MQNSKGAAEGQRIIFTGPDGIGDYRPRFNRSPYVGVGPLSPEATSDLSYLWRAAPHAPPPLPKQAYVGEVGWGWQCSAMLNDSTLHSGMQIRKSIVRMEVEDRASHKFLQQSSDDKQKT
ncbi:protein SPMIP2 [Vanacampus margaritifer]